MFDFDCAPDRRNTLSVKWTTYPEDVLPMWVADMDFLAPQPVREALAARVSHGIFGYDFSTTALAEAVSAWLLRRFGWAVSPEAVLFTPGVVSTMNLVLRTFAAPGDAAVVFTPIYPPFLHAPSQQGLQLIPVPLAEDEQACPRYTIDFDALERALTPRARVLLLCHPHNPVGREWTRDELLRLAELCLRHDLLICSDEIWGDLALGEGTHVPFAALSPEVGQRCVTLMAPSKTFNLPGLGLSFAVVQNPLLRGRLAQAAIGTLPHVNGLALVAAQAAYSACDDWLDALRAYLTANCNFLLSFVRAEMPSLRVCAPEATYLAWLDCRHALDGQSPYSFFLTKARVALSDGAGFGAGGTGWVRLNFGCPRSQLRTALERMRDALRSL
ncbi:MAG: PatB family C-S lyase [Thermoflexales bacterium]|nr:PatB family C-S lyase [Thermoflexales bacterium]